VQIPTHCLKHPNLCVQSSKHASYTTRGLHICSTTSNLIVACTVYLWGWPELYIYTPYINDLKCKASPHIIVLADPTHLRLPCVHVERAGGFLGVHVNQVTVIPGTTAYKCLSKTPFACKKSMHLAPYVASSQLTVFATCRTAQCCQLAAPKPSQTTCMCNKIRAGGLDIKGFNKVSVFGYMRKERPATICILKVTQMHTNSWCLWHTGLYNGRSCSMLYA